MMNLRRKQGKRCGNRGFYEDRMMEIERKMRKLITSL
jgi:hypothetical protein